MPNIYTLKSGLASDTTVWSGGAVPVQGDRVLICAGHTVELDGTYTWGDDSTATITINAISTTNSITVYGTGALKASRSVNSSLTAHGNISLTGTSSTCGQYDAGTAADPIPSSVTHTLILNKSAAMVSGKYGFDTWQSSNGQSYVTLHGKYRKRNALLMAALSAGATSAQVTDATGWVVGDQVVFAPTSAYNADDARTIATLTPGSGTTATITFAALTYAHAVDAPVGNFTSNVIVKSYAEATPGWLSLCSYVTSGGEGAIHVENVRFEGGGYCAADTTRRSAMPSLSYNAQLNTSTTPIDPVRGCAWYVTDGTVHAALVFYQFCRRFSLENAAFFNSASVAGMLQPRQGASLDFSDVFSYRSQRFFISSFSQGGVGISGNGFGIFGAVASPIQISSGSGFFLVNGVIGPTGVTFAIEGTQAASITLDSVDIFAKFGKGLATAVVAGNGSPGMVYDVTIENCHVEPSLVFVSNKKYNVPSSRLLVRNKNALIGEQELHTPPGSYFRDYTTKHRGASSVRMEPDIPATYSQSQSIAVPALSGAPVKVLGYLRKNSSYGSATRPTVTLSGLGITPQTFTLSDSVDTWEKFEFTATQTSGADGELDLTFTAQSVNSGAKAWLDGVPMPPFVTAVRHYGYKFQPSSVTREADPVAQLSESAAGALSGLSLSGTTVTLTGTRSVRELYDWCRLKMCEDLTLAEFITSADGVNFAVGFNLTIDGGHLTGAGAIAMPGNTLTTINGATSTLPITHNAGVFTAVNVIGYTVGARLQIYDVTAAAELYNDVPASGSLSLNVGWTADHTLRVRMARVVGTDADQLIQTFGALSSAGASFLLQPAPDEVYEANAIDGGTVTEFSADYPNVQIDLDDPDGVTSPLRGYAWYMAGQMTAPGIAAFHGGMTAEDAVNYRINDDILDMRIQNVGTNPVNIVGARIYRKDGGAIFAIGAGPISADPGKAYVAPGSATLGAIEGSAVLAKEATAQSAVAAARLAAALSA